MSNTGRRLSGRGWVVGLGILLLLALIWWIFGPRGTSSKTASQVIRPNATRPQPYGSTGEYLDISPRSGDLSHPYIKGKVVVVWKPSDSKVPMSEPGTVSQYWDALDRAPKLHPRDPGEIGTIVWVDARAVATGESYSNGMAAYEAVCDVTVIDKTANVIVGKKSFVVQPPPRIGVPQGETASPDAGMAWAPTQEIAKYIKGLPTKTFAAAAGGGLHWSELSPGTGSEDSFIGVAFADVKRGWMVGPDGVILASTDGGDTWSAQDSGTDRGLIEVAFTDADHGWAVGGGTSSFKTLDTSGTIVHTTDGGPTWSGQDSGARHDLYGVAFTDASHGWSVGSGGTIISTADGGAHWTAQKSGTIKSLNEIASADPTHAWAVGDGGIILATGDGGATWSAQDSGTGTDLLGVAFTDADHGWAVGGRTILATGDGGATWNGQDSGTSGALRGVAFADAKHGLAVGGRTILATSDGGATWRGQETINRDADLRDVALPDANHGLAVGDHTFFAATNGSASGRR